MSQRNHIKRRVEPSSQNEPSSSQNEPSSSQNIPSSSQNEPEYSETPKKGVDVSSLKERYNIRLPRSYKEQTSAPQIVHFSQEIESAIPETLDELKTGMLYSTFCIVSEMSIYSRNILPIFILFSEN